MRSIRDSPASYKKKYISISLTIIFGTFIIWFGLIAIITTVKGSPNSPSYNAFSTSTVPVVHQSNDQTDLERLLLIENIMKASRPNTAHCTTSYIGTEANTNCF